MRRLPRPGVQAWAWLGATLSLLSALPQVAAAPAAAAAAASAAASGWGRSFAFAPPAAGELLPPRVVIDGTGNALVILTRQDEEAPMHSVVELRLRRAGGGLGPLRRVPDAQEALAGAAGSTGSFVLTAVGARGRRCCTSAVVRPVRPDGRPGRPLVAFRGLSGNAVARPAVGSVAPLPQGVLAAVASPAGVWAAQSDPRGLRRPVRLSSLDQLPDAVAAAVTPSGRTLVVWDAAALQDPDAGSTRILLARGTATRLPGRAGVLLHVAAGHQIDALALGSGAETPALAWLESWYDRGGDFHSVLRLTRVGARHPPATFSVPRRVLSGLSLASDARGAAIAVVRACTRFGRCQVAAAFSDGAHALPAVASSDAGTAPALAVAPDGVALVAWIHRGSVFARRLTSTGGAPGAVHELSDDGTAGSVALAFGADGDAVAAFVQGLAAPRLGAAVFRER